MIRELPSLKAKPELVLGVLLLIRENSGNYKKMEKEVTSFWQRNSLRIKRPTARNSLRAVFGPSLRHLQLIRGEGNEIMLMPSGKELLQVYDRDGEIAFKKAFAKHLLKLDKERGVAIIFELQRLNRTVSTDELLEFLKAKFSNESHISQDRLIKFLWYYAYVGLVKFGGKIVELRQRQFESSFQDLDIEVSEEEFMRALFEQYKKLRDEGRRSPYVPIPDLRDKVCEKTGIWVDHFYTMLERIPKETADYMIHLTQPMLRKSGGITVAGKYFYYMGIFKKGEKHERI